MPILKTVVQNGMNLGYHEVVTVHITFTPMEKIVTVVMAGWPDALARLSNQGAQWIVQQLVGCSDYYDINAIESALILSGELEGGQIMAVPQSQTPLEYAKAKKWLQVKAEKEKEKYSPLPTPLGVFDGNRDSQKGITDAIMLLQTLSAMETPSTVHFVLFDNSVVELDVESMVSVGIFLGIRTQEIVNKASNLRNQINAAETVEEVTAINW